MTLNDDKDDKVPVINLSLPSDDELANQIAKACSEFGFFQVTHHHVDAKLIEAFRRQCQLYFALERSTKLQQKRSADNARGYFDDELTKQRRDWKECIDIGMPYSRDWNLPDDDEMNACLDGFNRMPPSDTLPDFRKTIVEYFEACAKLSDRLARLMARARGSMDDPLLDELKERHSSYLRVNYYPPCQETTNQQDDPMPLGISPHKDAGFLTVLLQDDDIHTLQVLLNNNNKWTTVHPASYHDENGDRVPAFTINTGDMAQVWSNGEYKAPLHRVLTDPSSDRYSAPFFYNPAYESLVRPTTGHDEHDKYHPLLWSYFRAVRFAGDLTDLGTEIQIDDYEKIHNGADGKKKKKSSHLERQKVFFEQGGSSRPFDVEQYCELLQMFP